jgi:hypothetical protein
MFLQLAQGARVDLMHSSTLQRAAAGSAINYSAVCCGCCHCDSIFSELSRHLSEFTFRESIALCLSHLSTYNYTFLFTISHNIYLSCSLYS